MSNKSIFTTTVYFIVWCFLFLEGDLLQGQVKPVLPPPDVQYVGPAGEIIDGIRCGTPDPIEERQKQIRQEVEQWLQEGNLIVRNITTIIPVAFHIVRHDNGSADVTNQQITDQLDVLNVSFVSSNFQFSLHSIERVNNTSWTTHSLATPRKRR